MQSRRGHIGSGVKLQFFVHDWLGVLLTIGEGKSDVEHMGAVQQGSYSGLV